MRTITFEWKKFCSFRYFWFLCGIVLLFNLWTLSENRKWEWFSGESLKAIYADLNAQPEEKQERWLERLGEKKYAVYADNKYQEQELYKKIRQEYRQLKRYDTYLEEVQKKSAGMSSVIFSGSGTFAYRNAKVTPAAYEDLNGLELQTDVSEGVIFATQTEFTDLCVVLMLVVTVYFLFLYEKNQQLYPLLRSCDRGRAGVMGAKLLVGMGITCLLVLIFYGGNYLMAFQNYGFGTLSRPIQSVTVLYESPYLLTVGEYLLLYLLVKAVVCYIILLLMLWISQKTESVAGGILGIVFTGMTEYLLSVFLPAVSYADPLKYINLAEYLKVYPMFSKYHNLNIFEYPVNAMTLFLIVVPLAFFVFLFLNMCTFCHCQKTKGRSFQKLRKKSRIGFVLDKLFLHEALKNLVTNRTIWVCAAVMYGAVLISSSVGMHRSIEEEYYRFYMTENSGKLTQEKLDYFSEERKRYEEIFAMTPQNSGLTKKEIDQKKSENRSAYDGFMDAYSQVRYVVDNNLEKGINEQALVYEKGYELLFGDSFQKERLMGILLCVIVAVYSASGSLGIEYDLEVMRLLQTTRRGRWELLKKKLYVTCAVTAMMFVLVKLPLIGKVANAYPLENWSAKVRSMMFAGQSVLNCSILGYVLLLLFMQLLTLLVIVLCVTAVSIVLKDTMLTMILSLFVFGAPLLLEWAGLSGVHYVTLNGLLDGHWLLQGNWFVLLLEVIIFWVELPFFAGYVLYRNFEERR